ncbi:hypothetical protein D3C81_2250150 [compost metagenome]
MQFSIFEAFTQRLFGKAENEFITDNQPARGQRFQVVTKAAENIRALNVFSR